jgi:hypothetical protein
MTSNIEGS